MGTHRCSQLCKRLFEGQSAARIWQSDRCMHENKIYIHIHTLDLLVTIHANLLLYYIGLKALVLSHIFAGEVPFMAKTCQNMPKHAKTYRGYTPLPRPVGGYYKAYPLVN